MLGTVACRSWAAPLELHETAPLTFFASLISGLLWQDYPGDQGDLETFDGMRKIFLCLFFLCHLERGQLWANWEDEGWVGVGVVVLGIH